ncbi:MAG: hypothetical protein LRY31_01075 [Burkholderiaceae bacterium]|nr:hypothetical protein [Burkholderiaceae bacterium]
MKQKDLAEALGLHKSVLSRYVRKGMPTVSVEAAKAWYTANIGVRSRPDQVAGPVEPEPVFPPLNVIRALPVSGPGSDEDFQAARTRREIAEANLAEMREAELEGKLIRVDVIRAAWAKRVASTRDALLQIPSRLAPTLAAQPDVDQVARLLEEELRQALAELSRDGVPVQEVV